jgi:hypothetical protein
MHIIGDIVKKRPPITRVDIYREQAERLQKFLEAGDHPIKRLVALEAIAAQYNSPNWNTLQATAEAQDQSTGHWLVVQHQANGPDVLILADSFVDGLRVFSTLCWQAACLLPMDSLSVGYEAYDAAYTGLYLTVGDESAVLLSLRRPGIAHFPDQAVPLFTTEVDDKNLEGLALDLAAGLSSRAAGTEAKKRERFELCAKSMTAVQLARQFADESSAWQMSSFASAPRDRVAAGAQQLFDSMHARLTISMLARIHVGDDE